MDNFMPWLGFIGSWLLFAGPIYQAALELQDEDIEVGRIRHTGSKIPLPPKVSSWWWLLPPIKFYKEFQRGKISRSRIVKALPREDLEAMISFNSKATAWLYVGLGGLCLACEQTYELSIHYGWNTITLVLLVLFMLGLSILNVVRRLKRAESIKNMN